MSPDARLREVLDDLEQQAAGLWVAERDAEVAELGVAEYAAVDLTSRLHASVGRGVAIRTRSGVRIDGRLDRVGSDFCLVTGDRESWLVPRDALGRVSGLSPRSLPAEARPAVSRLSIRSVLRRLAAEGSTILVRLGDDRCEGRVGRVGKDFFELGSGDRGDPGDPASVSVIPCPPADAIRIRP